MQFSSLSPATLYRILIRYLTPLTMASKLKLTESMVTPPLIKELIFAFMATSSVNELDSPMLADSIRTFAGRFSNHPIWVLIPKGKDVLTTRVEEMLLSLNVQLNPCEIDDVTLEFPFGGKVFASARAEALAEGQANLLV